jgi:hypothetical protein
MTKKALTTLVIVGNSLSGENALRSIPFMGRFREDPKNIPILKIHHLFPIESSTDSP